MIDQWGLSASKWNVSLAVTDKNTVYDAAK